MNLRVAIVHYWLISMRGGEKVVESLARIFPGADIYTHVVDKSVISQEIGRHRIETSFIAKLPWAKKYYQKYLPFMPLALEELDLRKYDLVISSESGPAKGVVVRPDALHVCYCHSPMRYLWDMYHEYKSNAGLMTRIIMPVVAHKMRMWDTVSSARVDTFVANSSFVAQRIEKAYRRRSVVVAPPVDIQRFSVTENDDGYYLFFGQLTSYKMPSLAVDAFNSLDARLIVIGCGELEGPLRRRAAANIDVLGRVSDDDVVKYLENCKALIFPGVEDFGIVPIEAMACGKPVIAYGRGGALDYVIPGVTGILFYEQTEQGLASAVQEFESKAESFDPLLIRAYASGYDISVFENRMKALCESELDRKRAYWSGKNGSGK